MSLPYAPNLVHPAPPQIDSSLDATTFTGTTFTGTTFNGTTVNATSFKSNTGGFTSPFNIGGTGSAAYVPEGLYTPIAASGGKVSRFYSGAVFIGTLGQQAGNWGITDVGLGRFAFLRCANAAGTLGISERADNAAAVAAGLVVGDFYKTGDAVKVVHV